MSDKVVVIGNQTSAWVAYYRGNHERCLSVGRVDGQCNYRHQHGWPISEWTSEEFRESSLHWKGSFPRTIFI